MLSIVRKAVGIARLCRPDPCVQRFVTQSSAYCHGGVADFGTNRVGDDEVIQADVEDDPEDTTEFVSPCIIRSEEHKEAVIDHFSELNFPDMTTVLDRLQHTMQEHPTHPAFNVTSRPPTKEEISRGGGVSEDNSEDYLLNNPDLFQLGVPFRVEYVTKLSPFAEGDCNANYSGEVKFSLFGLAGSLQLEYQASIQKYGGYDHINLIMRFESDACTTTLVNLKRDDFYCVTGEFGERFKWDGFGDKPVLNSKLIEMGFDQTQSALIVKGLFEKLEPAFEGSGLRADPCELYMQYLTWYIIQTDGEVNWGAA